jgi:hypothetical protein
MAISDKLATFCDDTALNTGGAGDYVLGDQIDLDVTTDGIVNLMGLSQLFLVITCEDDATSGGSATGDFKLVTDDAADLSGAVTLASTGPIAVAAITPGAILGVIPLPHSTAYKEFLGIVQTTAVAAFTAGSINAYITPTPPNMHTFPQNSAIEY